LLSENYAHLTSALLRPPNIPNPLPPLAGGALLFRGGVAVPRSLGGVRSPSPPLAGGALLFRGGVTVPRSLGGVRSPSPPLALRLDFGLSLSTLLARGRSAGARVRR
jgi:hypothetical protein